MRTGMNWMGLVKDRTFGLGSEMRCGGGPSSIKEEGDAAGQQEQQEQPDKDVVLDHIILDLTGKSVPLDQIEDASTKRAFKRKKRLLRHSNTVLISRLGIMALVTIMLVITTLLTWYFTSTYSARSVKSLAGDLRKQLIRSSLQVMVSVLGEVYNATLILSSLHQQVYHSSSNTSWDSVEPELRRVNRGVFNAQTQYSSVAFVSKDGLVTDYSRSKNLTELYFFVNATSVASPVWYTQTVTGYVNESTAPPPTVRQTPYPLSAENLLNTKPVEVYWTIVANIWNEAVLSPAVPVRNDVTDDFLGLATITSRFTNLNNYLSTLDLLNGILYFEWHSVQNGSLMVAFSYNGTNDTLTSPLNSSNPFVRAAGQYLNSAYDYGVLSTEETTSENVRLSGQNYYIDTVPLTQQLYDNLNLTAVLIVPRKSIMGRIDRRNHTVIKVSVGTAVGVLVLGCCFICFLTSKMSTEMQLRQELIRLLVGKHRAEQSSNYKSQFLANMSHELRTPIAAIIGLLDLLSCDSLTPDQEISVSQIRNCSTGLLALVNNVLDISKVEAGRMELEAAPFSITDELEALVDIYAVQSARSNIDVVLDLSEDFPAVVKGDATRIRQIFSNLLSNSTKFTTQGHVLLRGWVDQSLLEQNEKQAPLDFRVSSILSRRHRVSGRSFQGFENQVALVFELRDTGCGIPVELRETVFDSFVQADSSTTRTHGGSGLGLYIVRSLVELMCGEVRIVPMEGPGTMMRFHIIVDRADSHQLFSEPGAGAHRLSYASEPDWFHSVLAPPSGNPLDMPVKRPSQTGVPERAQVLVAMQEGVAQKVAVKWLEKDGLSVTRVTIWEDIIPVLEDLLRRSELNSKDVGNGVSGLGIDSRYAHNHPAPRRSQVSDSLTEVAKFPSVLALIDVTMHPGSMKMGLDNKVVEPSVLGPRNTDSNRPDSKKLPSHMEDLLDGMLRIHSQYSVAVGWIVAPDCRARWKQALQADGRFLVAKKPLTGSRMRQMLGLMSRTEKLGPHHWDLIHSSQSCSPSPSLRSLALSNSDEGNPIIFAEDSREYPVLNVEGPGDGPVSSAAPASSLVEAPIIRTQTRAEAQSEDAGSHLSSPDGQQQDSRETSPGREFSAHSVSQTGETVPQTNTEFRSDTSSADVPENSSNVGVEETDSPLPGPIARDVTAASPSTGLRRVFMVDIPPDPDGSPPPDRPSVAESPIHGLNYPEAAENEPIIIRNERDYLPRVNEVQEIQVHASTTAVQSPAINEPRASPPSSHETVTPSRPDAPSSAARKSAKAFRNQALSSLHILLVEDTPVLQRLASMMLKKLGANVTVVGDGQQAVKAVSEAVESMQRVTAPYLSYSPHFDLILMDCAMPVMDGYNATLAIRAAEENTERHIPIVALTAHALASDEERCLSVGMDAYLTKPIDCQRMVTTIQDLVSKGRA